MDIQIGDRIIFKDGSAKLIYDGDRLNEIKQYIYAGGNLILKIERPKYEVVEENKDKKISIVDVIQETIVDLYKKCPKNSTNDFMIIERNHKVAILLEILTKIKELRIGGIAYDK